MVVTVAQFNHLTELLSYNFKYVSYLINTKLFQKKKQNQPILADFWCHET